MIRKNKSGVALSMSSDITFERLRNEVIEPGLCTHCGSCVGLSEGTLQFNGTSQGPLPEKAPGKRLRLESMAYDACPGKGLHYALMNDFVFGQRPDNWLIGCYRKIYLGYSNDPGIRRAGASGGVLTHINAYLLESGKIDGCVVLRHGYPEPWLSSPVIAQSVQEVIDASQSVYIPTPVNTILPEMDQFEGKLSYVGLPDQVCSLRRLQQLGNTAARKVAYVAGPYVGTAFYSGAIESFLRSKGIRHLEDLAELRYREGEWPGYLKIRTTSGREIKAKKFYYNYLIPFYITQSSLLSVDFTNELTDVSVGDAWHPELERLGAGYSVIVARTEKGEQLLDEMCSGGLLNLKVISLEEALSMHAHMIDFKKRGAFIRMGWRKFIGLPTPNFGYRPAHIPLSRKMVELVISGLFMCGRTRMVRKIAELIPIAVIGRLFEGLRAGWKKVSRGTKRKGLADVDFRIEVEPLEFQEV